MKPLDDKRILVTGGTGSLGKVLVRRLLACEMGNPVKIIVFSRDEAKQHFMRMEYQHKVAATDEIIYQNFRQKLEFRIGDVRDFHSIAAVLRGADVVFNAAALKQVPTCEYFPWEAVQTNISGPENLIRAIQEHRLPIETVVGISTDKACKPINTMGMTKAIQERVFIQANMRCQGTRFLCARYGNVLASRGSVIPLFHDQILNGGPVTITTPDMTRFLLTLDDAVDTIFAAVKWGLPGDTFVPRAPSALVADIATALIGDRQISLKMIGIRPGEKIHESLISEEEALRTVACHRWFAILPMLPEVRGDRLGSGALAKEYSSADTVMTLKETTAMLRQNGLLLEDVPAESVETHR
ncbi:MAG: polysaccharide biosynthesis protein [Acidobacteria bacterium]|nr:polysaccharide biosynthesis protein [Acidobacteriota bacterium]MCI0719214.1 polysaccharide biosynthesis protein [Acidobacteriota bacterium]